MPEGWAVPVLSLSDNGSRGEVAEMGGFAKKMGRMMAKRKTENWENWWEAILIERLAEFGKNKMNFEDGYRFKKNRQELRFLIIIKFHFCRFLKSHLFILRFGPNDIAF